MSSPFPALSDLSQRAQAIALQGAVSLSRVAGPRAASAFGGWLAATVGLWLPASRIADRNLRQALPDLTAAERAGIIRAVWNNLGRNAAELPHLCDLTRTAAGRGWEVEGEEHIDSLRVQGTPALFFSGHFGNWELILPIAAGLGLEVSGFYRAASNPAIDTLIQSLRQKALAPGSTMFAKGREGARQALTHLQGGGSLGFLVDQKMNDGIPVAFFGREAMTAPALAQLALRFGLPIVPVHVVRLGAGRFRMVCEAPLAVPLTGQRQTDIHAITLAMNMVLERWIRQRPEAWLWLHRRWPKERPADPAIHAPVAEPA